MAQPLPTPHNTLTGSNIEIIAGSADHSQINRLIATPGAKPRQEMGAMRYVLTSCVALAAMTAAALADAPSPTRLSESQLDTITAGLNIDPRNFFAVTGCNTCIQYKENSGTNRLAASYAISFDDADSGSAAGYAGPLGILALGAANGNSLGGASAGGQDADGIAYAGAQAGGGQGVAGVYNGPLGILKVGAAGEPSQRGRRLGLAQTIEPAQRIDRGLGAALGIAHEQRDRGRLAGPRTDARWRHQHFEGPLERRPR